MVLGYTLEWFNKNHINLCNLLKSSKTQVKIKSPQMLYYVTSGIPALRAGFVCFILT